METPDSDHDPHYDEEGEEEDEDEAVHGMRMVSMREIIRARNKGIKFQVHWNDYNQPIEPHGSLFASYIGVAARENIPITIDDWRNKELRVLKNLILKIIEESFIIGNEKKHINYVLMEAGKLHRMFRHNLTRDFVRDSKGNINEHPPRRYARFITEEQWKIFVEKRTGVSFQDVSKKNSQRASNPKYPYRASRMRYTHLEQKMINKSGLKVKSIERYKVWKAARTNKDGVIENENVQKVCDECENLSQLSQEAVEADGDLDILSRAIKDKHYSGCVRGMGFGVSQRDCFPPKKRPKHEDLESLKSSLKDVMARLNQVERELHETKMK